MSGLATAQTAYVGFLPGAFTYSLLFPYLCPYHAYGPYPWTWAWEGLVEERVQGARRERKRQERERETRIDESMLLHN